MWKKQRFGVKIKWNKVFLIVRCNGIEHPPSKDIIILTVAIEYYVTKSTINVNKQLNYFIITSQALFV